MSLPLSSPITISADGPLEIELDDTTQPNLWRFISDASNNLTLTITGAPELVRILSTHNVSLTSPTATAGNLTLSGWMSRGNGVLCVVDTIGGQTLATTPTWTAINFNSVVRQDTCFSFTAGTSDVTVNVDGWYEIDVDLSSVVTAGILTFGTICRLMEDTGGGFAEIVGARSFTTNFNLTASTGTAHTHLHRQFTAGTMLRIEATRTAGIGTVQTILNGSRFNIKRV